MRQRIFYLITCLAAGAVWGLCFPPGATAARVTSDLVVLYKLEEGSGVDVHDTSGAPPAIDLIDNTPTATTWIVGGMLVNTTTVIASTGPAAKVFNACTISDEITLEAWVRPANLTQDGPARILTMSLDGAFRNFTLCQSQDRYGFLLRTTTTTANGTPTLYTFPGVVTTNLTHVVCTRNAGGNVQIYVDSSSVTTHSRAGDFSNWDNSFQLALANELSLDDRRWFGEIHLAAIYSRALSAAEILQNFNAGANPVPTFTVTPSRTITPTAIQSVTPGDTFTPTVSPTLTHTHTPRHSLTRTPTNTAGPTRTVTPLWSTTPTMTAEAFVDPDAQVIVYPVPATGDWLYFNYRLPSGGLAVNEIFNVVGEKVQVLRQRHASAGLGQMQWDIRQVAPGLYFYRLQLDLDSGETRTLPVGKFIIIK